MRVLQPDTLGRMLHNALYQRCIRFAQLYTPEFPAHNVVTTWLGRFYMSDPALHILVEMSQSYEVTAHCIISVEEGYNQRVAMCHQVEDDSRKGIFVDEVVEYLGKLRDSVNAVCSTFTVSKNVKALEKKYGYQVARTVMIQYPQHENGGGLLETS